MPQLETETRVCQRLLKTIVADAAHNEVVMARCQERELALLAAEDLEQLLERLTTGMRRSFGLEEVVLLIIDPDKVMTDLMGTLGIDPKKYPGFRLIHSPAELKTCGGSFEYPVLTAWNQRQHGKLFSERGLQSASTLPLHRADGLVGCLALGSRDPDRFTQEHATEFLQRLATISAVCLENAVNRERLRLLGLTDPLTGLYNRRHLERRLQEEVARSRRHHQPLSCLFVDADNFKRINDAYGHTVGDQVLRQLAQRLREVLRSSDIATRYGGEEFALLLP